MKPTFEVQVAGSPISGVTSVSASFGISQDSGACTVAGIGLSGTARDTLVAYAGWDGSTALMFNGELVEPEYELWPRQATLVGQDYMARLSKPWGNGYYEYVSQTADAVIRNLIEKSGIDSSLHHVIDLARIIGAQNPLQLRDGTPQSVNETQGAGDIPLSLIREIIKLDLLWIASRSNGAIYVDTLATGSPVASYTAGLPLRRFRWKKGNPNDIKNKYLIKGYEALGFAYQGSASATNSLLVDPFAYILDGFQSNLIESDVDAAAIAAAYLAFYNRLIPTCEFTVDGNLDIQPGVTLGFDISECSLSSTSFFVTQATHTIGNDFVTSGSAMAI